MKNKYGETHFLCSCIGFAGHGGDKKETRMFLVERGANIKARAKNGDNALNYLFICQEGFGLNYSHYSDSAFLKLLVERGIDINSRGAMNPPIFGCLTASLKHSGITPYINFAKIAKETLNKPVEDFSVKGRFSCSQNQKHGSDFSKKFLLIEEIIPFFLVNISIRELIKP